jgi:hypothetical protein
MDMLIPEMVKNVNGIQFNIHKKIAGHKIIKSIDFEDKEKFYAFKEEVQAFDMHDFKQFFAQSGFQIVQCFGNYNLENFNVKTSDRLIFICKKAQ